jgi:hypothetical protein
LVDASGSEKHDVSNFSPEDEDSMFLQNVGNYQQVYMAPKTRSSSSNDLSSCKGSERKLKNVLVLLTDFNTEHKD